MKKINTVEKIDFENYNVKLGTFDKKNPQTIYIEVCSYIEPKNENYEDDINKNLYRELNKSLKKMISETSLFSRTFMSVLDLPENRLKPGRKTYISFEYHLFQNNIIPFKKLTDYKDIFIDKVLNNFNNYLSEHNFIISKTNK